MNRSKSPLGKTIKKMSFFYPIFQTWRRNIVVKIITYILLILIILLLIYIKLGCNIVRCTMITGVNSTILTYIIGWFPGVSTILFLSLLITLICCNKWKFNAGIYSKGVELQFEYYYDDIIDVKIFRYFENRDAYIKFIFTKKDGLITTETFLYNNKMEKFLDKFQESFRKKGITCEKINDIKGVDICERVDYKAKLGFRNMRRLMSKKKRKEHIEESYRSIFGIVIFVFGGLIAAFDKHYPKSFPYFVVAGFVTFIILTILSILRIGDFDATIENNAVWFDDYHYCVLSKIKKAHYETNMRGNVEIICLSIDDGNSVRKYRWPKNGTVELFCNDLLNKIKKRNNNR